MFRPMRRNKQLLSQPEVEAVLARNTNGVLAVHGDDGYPYAVPLSYVYTGGKLYFHWAKAGHKLDAISANPKVSFTVVDEDTIVSAEYTSYFRSVIAFGEAAVVTDEAERLAAFRALCEKYSSDQPLAAREHEIAHCTQALIVGVTIRHITGKQAKEYVGKQGGAQG